MFWKNLKDHIFKNSGVPEPLIPFLGTPLLMIALKGNGEFSL